MTDIFEFWGRMKRGQRIHPADEEAFKRMSPGRHGFQLSCLPGCFAGRLRTAPVVLLYLSPGFAKADLADARSKQGQEHRLRSWQGNEPMRDHGPGFRWLVSRTKLFADANTVRNNFAILNIGAYHSKDVRSYSSLLALPSSRVSISWAQEKLFPEAEAGKRIVICMRSASYWGLDAGRKYSGTLFAPLTTRSGHLVKSGDREQLVRLVRTRLGEADRL